ncbi:MarR family winged helix-turn-helix transcriptional regulator [Methylocystis heyeri]|uniref:MarR family winged helix-turn-helix transcriptional regulator n=1 Tax=Methylocystis heyeri TaxID=391905 RepID=UPI001FE7788C|nr:MarR family winged helix-turn-helix transcriptional regulator [Methylocystis heyeri]
MRRTSRTLNRHYGQFLAQAGLEPTQYSLLVACSLARSITVSRLAEALAIERSALARNLGVMEKAGLVRVVPGEDRRTRLVTLTETGAHKLAEALPLWRKAQATVENRFGADRLRELLSELRALAREPDESPGA